ncbi:hypothetical protein [Streptomyces sp. SAS_270]|uniref:hypothetical protein n=1 Tax=Streptomyces sp. SAS_270 TaxID=3412748 RepID=UPI00403C4C5B
MTRMQKYVAAAAVAAALAGVPSVSYAVSQGKTAHGTTIEQSTPFRAKAKAAAAAHAVARKAPTARVVASGEHVTAAPGFELWLTADGKHWTTPGDPEPQFRSVVDGNIDLGTPGVSRQSESTGGRYTLSGLYYGGKGTASRVEIETGAGTVHGKLLTLAGKPGWGVWYATTAAPAKNDGFDFIGAVTVYDTRGKVYAQLK